MVKDKENREGWLQKMISTVHNSQALRRHFDYQREHFPKEAATEEEIKRLTIELTVARYRCRADKEFARADAYRWILGRMGFDVEKLDMELSPPRDPGLKKWITAREGRTVDL